MRQSRDSPSPLTTVDELQGNSLRLDESCEPSTGPILKAGENEVKRHVGSPIRSGDF